MSYLSTSLDYLININIIIIIIKFLLLYVVVVAQNNIIITIVWQSRFVSLVWNGKQLGTNGDVGGQRVVGELVVVSVVATAVGQTGTVVGVDGTQHTVAREGTWLACVDSKGLGLAGLLAVAKETPFAQQ